MSKASNESIQKFVQITRHTAVAGVVAWSAIATLPVVASAALPGERIGVDASTMEANAALRSIVSRDDGEWCARAALLRIQQRDRDSAKRRQASRALAKLDAARP